MNKGILLVLMVIGILSCLPTQTYAAFPIAAQKTETTTAAKENSDAVTITQKKEIKHTGIFKHKKLTTAAIIGLGILGLLALVFGGLGVIFGIAGYSAAIGLGVVAVVLGAIGLYMNSNTMMSLLGVILGGVAIILGILI